MHAGWAAQSGIRAALMARGGFKGPRTVLEGTHGFYKAFAPSIAPDFDAAPERSRPPLGDRGPGVQALRLRHHDAALHRLRARAGARRRVSAECDRRDRVRRRRGHRAPPVGAAGLEAAAADAVRGEVQHARTAWPSGSSTAAPASRSSPRRASPIRRCSRWRREIRYRINPADEYPRNFSGHLRATLRDGSTREYRQPHMRGGAREPLGDDEVRAKFLDNAVHGGLSQGRGGAACCGRPTAAEPRHSSRLSRSFEHERRIAARGSRGPGDRQLAQHRPRHRAGAGSRRRRRDGERAHVERCRRARGGRDRSRQAAGPRSTRRTSRGRPMSRRSSPRPWRRSAAWTSW